MKTFFSLLKREFKLFWSNKVLVILFLGAPMFYGILLGYVYSKGKVTDLPVVVVDEDNSILSEKIRQMFDDNEVLTTVKLLPNKNNLKNHMVENEAACAVVIPKGFQKGVYGKKYPEVVTILNTSNVLTANYSSSAVNRVLSTLKAGIEIEVLNKKGTPRSIAIKEFEPFKTTYIKNNNRATNYMYFLWPGVLAVVLQQVILLAMALSFSSEYENNTFLPLVLKSDNSLMLIFTKIFPYFLMSIGIWGCYLLFAWWFKMPVNQNIGVLTMVSAVFVLAVSFLGILVSIIIPSQLKATEVLMVVATPSFILSGYTWPLSQMPQWVQAVSSTIPSTHYLKIVRLLMVEKAEVYHILPSFYAILTIGGVCAVLAFIILTLRVKKTKKYATKNDVAL